MPMRGDPGAGGLRGALVAFIVIAVAIAGSWVIPGFAWRGLAAMERPASGAVLVPADSIPRSDSAAHAAPTVPGRGAGARGGAARRPVSLASRLSGLIGIVLILAIGILLSHNRRAIRWRVIAWGLGLQLLFAIFVLRIPAGQALFRWLGALVTGILGYSYIGSQFVFGELGKPALEPRRDLRLPAAARHHLRLARCSPSSTTWASCSSWSGPSRCVMSRVHGRERRGEPQRRRVDLHGADRGAAHDPAVPAADDAVRADDGHDVGHGPHLGLDHGGVHRVRHRGPAPAHRGDHDRAGHDHDGQAVRARDRDAGDLRQGQARHAQAPT